MNTKRNWSVLLVILIVGGLVLTACGQATPQVTEVTRIVKETVSETVIVEGTPQVVEKEVTRIVEVEKEVVVTAAPEPGTEPKVGGTLRVAFSGDLDTLDIQYSGNGDAMALTWLLDGTLVSRDANANYFPWLAESWETSEDGLTWDFHLRKDVKFHNGEPLTAQDFAWTINRLLDPATNTSQPGLIGKVANAEALDDYTLRLNMVYAYPVLLERLSTTAVVCPYNRKSVEELGDKFGREFIGVGPYKLVEWQTGEKVVVERNPDFTWQPPFVQNRGPYYIERIEFRIIPEPSTIVAAMETGEIDYATVPGADVQRLLDTGHIQIFESQQEGMWPALHMNLSRWPFKDDVKVRQAFNYAVDRETLVAVVLEGRGEPQYGPISPRIAGYWPGVEEIGQHFDLEKAKALMAESGYTPGSDGILEQDGKRLALTLKCEIPKLCEVLQQQYRELGVDLTIQVVDSGISWDDAVSGDYDITTMGYVVTDWSILTNWFHTSNPSAHNLSQSAPDPELDRLLDLTLSTVDPVERQKWVDEAQKYLVENAWVVPLYTETQYTAVNTRVHGVVPNPAAMVTTFMVQFNDAWIEE